MVKRLYANYVSAAQHAHQRITQCAHQQHTDIRSNRTFRKQFRSRSPPYVPLIPLAAGGSWRTFVWLEIQGMYLMNVYFVVKEQ